MAGLYEQFKAKKQKMEQWQTSRKRDRQMKKIDRADWKRSTATTCPPSTEEYRNGWDRIFGGASAKD